MPRNVTPQRRKVAALSASVSAISASSLTLLEGHPHIRAGVCVLLAVGVAYLIAVTLKLQRSACAPKQE